MTVPALRELRRVFPSAHITLATRAWAEGLFAGAEFIDSLQVHDGSGLRSVVQQVRQWQKQRFDLAVLFPNSLEAALVASLSRVPVRIGYATEGRQVMLTHPLPLPEWRSARHEIFYYLNIIASLEKTSLNTENLLGRQPDTSLTVAPATQAAARDLLRSSGVRPNRPVVALCPGSINSRAKRWPVERYAALADLLIERVDAEVLLIGSGGETAVSSEVTALMRNQAIELTGKTSLAQLVGVLSLVDLLVTNDTGPAHIAAALARPTLVIFGPTNPLTTKPFSDVAEIVRQPPDCAPCMLRDCPIDHRCMTAINPEEVFQRATAFLSGRLSSTASSQTESFDRLNVAGY